MGDVSYSRFKQGEGGPTFKVEMLCTSNTHYVLKVVQMHVVRDTIG